MGLNLELRHFQDELINLVNLHKGLSWEERLICLELVTNQVQKQADEAIREELKEEEKAEDAKSI